MAVENKKEIEKEIKKVVRDEAKKQNVLLTNDQMDTVAALVDEAVAVTGGVNKETLINVGTYVGVAALGAVAGAGVMAIANKFGKKTREAGTPQTTTLTSIDSADREQQSSARGGGGGGVLTNAPSASDTQ